MKGREGQRSHPNLLHPFIPLQLSPQMGRLSVSLLPLLSIALPNPILTRCPVCRSTTFRQGGRRPTVSSSPAAQMCVICQSASNLWICLICGNVGWYVPRFCLPIPYSPRHTAVDTKEVTLTLTTKTVNTISRWNYKLPEFGPTVQTNTFIV